MPEDEIEAAYGADAPDSEDDFEIWEENWQSWKVFSALTTQWIVRDGLFGGTYQGIRYSSIQPVMWAYGVKDRRAVFDDVREMERAALGVLNGAEQ